LTRLLDAAPVGMVVATTTGQLIYSNRAFGDLLGYGAPDAQLDNLADLIHDNDSAAARLQFERLARGEIGDYRGEHQLRQADGSPIWAMVVASVLEAKGGDPRQVLVQMTSIELQKRAEEALVYSESRWHSALESARQGVWDYDMRKDRMFYSHMWRVLRGIPDDEIIGEDHDLHWLDRIHPEDRERARIHSKKQG